LNDISKAPPPLSLRLGHTGAQALEALARARGVSKAEAARQAIEEAAERERRRSGLAAEVERLMKDPADVEESREIAKMMEELRGPW
jgi:predicted DNA-binding protein